jgi:hypothetical protein
MTLQQVSVLIILSSLSLSLFPFFTDLPNSGPVIQGEEKQYQIGDILSLNCTSGKSQPRSILTFFINDEQVSTNNTDTHTNLKSVE